MKVGLKMPRIDMNARFNSDCGQLADKRLLGFGSEKRVCHVTSTSIMEMSRSNSVSEHLSSTLRLMTDRLGSTQVQCLSVRQAPATLVSACSRHAVTQWLMG